jgi:arsenate reductase
MSQPTIFHNPRCSKSRATLRLLEEKEINFNMIIYLETPPDKETLIYILDQLGMEPRELMRTHEHEYTDNTLADPSLSRDELINAMLKFPKLIERPIVLNDNKVIIGRPPENVLDIL